MENFGETELVDKYVTRAERMVSRWAGTRGPSRPRIEPKESITSRGDGAGDGESNGVSIQNAASVDVSINALPDECPPITVTEPARQIPVLASCQVLVVGGGPSGLSAAIAARRAGADVILMERFGCFGGCITTVGMETIGWYRYEGTVDCEGIGIEMERLAARMGGTIKWPFNESECLDADFFKLVADHLVKESGVRPLLHCFAVEAIMDGSTIKGVITESKSGRKAILADRVIDCSGDADVAFLAGAKYRKTEKSEMMGVTTVFSASGVDKQKFLAHNAEKPATYADWSRSWEQETTGKENHLKSPYWDAEFDEAREKGVIPAQNTANLCGSWSALSDAGEATNLNLAHMSGYDCTDVEDLTKAEMEGREQAMYALTALKHVVPGFEGAKLRNFSMTIGTRDSRKILGRYNLTGDDVRNQAKFEDSIGIFPEFIDGYSILILPTTGRYFQVPFGCLVPVGVENLLVAGRCVAGDKTSHAAMRNMMACTVTGQGAGVGAAVSLREGVTTSAVSVAKIQEELEKQGVRIH